MKLLCLPSLVLALSACAAPQQETRTAVPEGINDSFLADDADVDRFAGRWELESREVYANRDEILATLQIEPGETVAEMEDSTGAESATATRVRVSSAVCLQSQRS